MTPPRPVRPALLHTRALRVAVAFALLATAVLGSTLAGPVAAATASTTLGDAAASWASSQVGTVDSPSASYCNRYSAHFGVGSSVDPETGATCGSGTSAESWCANFAADAWQQAGVSFTYGYDDADDLSGRASSFYYWGLQHGTWHAVGSGYVPQAGDAALYGPPDSAAHVGIVVGGTATSPTVVNGDFWNTASTIDGVVEQSAQTTNGAGADLSGYVTPTLSSSTQVAPPSSGQPDTYATLATATIRTLSSTVASAIRVVPASTEITISCYVTGQAVSGDTVWDHVTTGGFISDTLLLTGSDSAVVPECPLGTITGPFPTLGATAIHTQPSTGSATVRTLAAGVLLTVDCTVTGELADGETLWDHVTGAGFVPDGEVLTGSDSAVVAPCTLTQLAPTPTVTGVAAIGRRLSVVAGVWAPAPVTLSYQWRANGRAVPYATASSFTPTGRQRGASITVSVTGAKRGFASATVTSLPTRCIR